STSPMPTRRSRGCARRSRSPPAATTERTRTRRRPCSRSTRLWYPIWRPSATPSRRCRSRPRTAASRRPPWST
ncbi:hypothetical protein KR018_001499, partial [Drosophila ironensis]